MIKKTFVFLFAISFILSITHPVSAAKKKRFDQSYDKVWDAAKAVVDEKGLGKHPHGKAKGKKKKGKIKTPVYRYFKISSARPVVETQYRDSYVIKIKKVEVPVPQPAAAKTPKVEENAAADVTLKPGDTAVDAKKAPVAPKVETTTKVDLSIKRTFEIWVEATRTWDKANPKEHNVGYSEAYLMKAIEARLSGKGAGKKVEQANLNINPPIVVE